MTETINKTGGKTKNHLATVRVEQLDKMDVTTFGQKSAELDLDVNFSHKTLMCCLDTAMTSKTQS